MSGDAVFERVVCGVDASDAGTEAARAAALVTAPGGSLTLVSASDPSVAVHAGYGMSQVLEELAREATAALDRGRAAAEPLHQVETRLVEGDPVGALKRELESLRATAVVVGSHGLSRRVGIALGSVTTYLLHEAPCAVLVARGPVDVATWPRGIVVGVDGSPHSARAFEAAAALGERLGTTVRAIVARDDHVDLEAARRIAPGVEEHPARPLDTLNVASENAGLVVVGSRGLKGIRALGSLSERVAHEARCSVLVVRGGDGTAGRR